MWAAAILIWLIIFAGIYVLLSFFYLKLFQKAGVQGDWRAWVPVYRDLIFLKLGDVNPWLWFFIFVPYIGSLFVAVLQCLAAYRIGLKLGKEGAMVVLYIFLMPVWLGIMAFDRSRWNVAIAPAAWAGGFFADTSIWDGIPAQNSYYQAQYAPGAYQPYAQPGYPQQNPYAQPAQPQQPYAQQGYPEQNPYAQPGYPHQNPYGQPAPEAQNYEQPPVNPYQADQGNQNPQQQ